MERRVALATAAAAALTLGLGTVAFASIGGAGVLGLAGGDSAAQIVPGSQVQEVQNIVVVVSGSTTTLAGAPADTAGGAVAPAGEPEATTPVVVPVWTGAPTVTTPAPSSTPTPTTVRSTTSSSTPTTTKTTVTVTATTPKPATTTTAAPVTTTPATNAPTTTVRVVTTTTSRPPGVPADWPANKPIPPMPPHCQQPQLELNGVWNCDN